MPTPQPLKQYLDAVKHHQEGNEEAAAESLASAMGVEKPSNLMKDAIGDFLDTDTVHNDMALRIIAAETAKREEVTDE